MIDPYPLRFEPMLLPKVWGGRRLAAFGKALPPRESIGESWELADLGATSRSGAGGAPAASMIANGALRGRPIREAMTLWGAALLGDCRPTCEGGFPLLVKFLDARENLSVQTHPSATFAAANPTAHLKTECWYILSCEPGSLIYKGVRPGVTRASFFAKLREGDGSRVLEDIVAVPARVGDLHNLPSGTVHALGAGVLAAEVQTPSDTTFRVYDWGRTRGPLHLEEAEACIAFEPAPDSTRLAPGASRARLVDTPYFAVEALRVREGESARLDPPARRYCVITALSARATLTCEGSAELQMVPGDSVLAPASLAPRATLAAQTSGEILLTFGGSATS